MTQYQINALQLIWPFLLPNAAVAVIYFVFLKVKVMKRLLVSMPSIVFCLLPLIIIVATPDAMTSINRAIDSIFDICIFVSYFAAILLIIFNGSYVRTRLHWLQVINIYFAVATMMGIALIGD